MKRYTHVIVGFTVGAYTASSLLEIGINGFMASIGSTIPDLDLRFKHRKLLHNVFIPMFTWFSLYLLLGYVGLSLFIDKFALLIIGWVSHVLIDALTMRGVYVAYPISNKRFSLKLFRSDSLIGNVVISLIAIIFLLFKIYRVINL